ncbi:efflux RND transporter periplasmic adaptor subunit [Thalassotalea sediminis]|uniref:efflux RND transporter periplasmic adaptor subunit n=1 Tax=Thalassotalea sediminis TaxID=1759089 RepID=UPI002572F9D6|nr:efflux RND transporter periplasmic adaptor subunit [Thalassotalea sediminis]
MNILHFSKTFAYGLLLPLTFLSATSEAFQGRAANVNVTEVIKTTLSPVAWVSGSVVSRNNSEIAANVSGRLLQLADLGVEVKQGDIIAQLDDKPLKLQLQELTANVENAKAALAFEKAEVRRKQALVKQKLIAQQLLEETTANYNKAKAYLAAEQARLAQTEQDLAYTKLRAPFDGIVAKRLRNQGEFVNNGNAIIRLVETANVEASLFAPLTAYRFLKQSTDLAIKSPLGEGVAPIKSIIPVADSRSHLMEVRLDMRNLDWPIGLDIKAAVATGASKETLAVPRDSLVLRRNQTSIFIVDDTNTAQQVNVEIGISQHELLEVIGDINEGDLVVIRGAERLQPGQAVNIKKNNHALVSGNVAAEK